MDWESIIEQMPENVCSCPQCDLPVVVDLRFPVTRCDWCGYVEHRLYVIDGGECAEPPESG